MKLKFDHSHINETAYMCFTDIDTMLSLIEERDIRIIDFSKRVFTAIVSEIYMALHDCTVNSARTFAKSFISKYSVDNLIPFIDTYINNESFRNSFNRCVTLKDFNKAVDLCNYSIGIFKGKEILYYNDLALSMMVDTPKKAYIAVVLRSLTPLLIRICELSLFSSCSEVFDKHISFVLNSFMVHTRFGHYVSTNYACSLPETLSNKLTLLRIASISLLSSQYYESVVFKIKQVSPVTVSDLFASMDATYFNQFIVYGGEIGLRSLSK